MKQFVWVSPIEDVISKWPGEKQHFFHQRLQYIARRLCMTICHLCCSPDALINSLECLQAEGYARKSLL
ncbi:hypothetical protein TRIATDRAFT_258273 [Trichoderma atroviride IMI 206040]|uniref:Uncharacterized protein n=1 Tax=Hypocrea atroviridis (strain ATCC 20476 / IMI 206040) TaxID=452589 RepID=G9P3H8_HYPAI|nr:uncharacterized protein TRIATDRAFT_258273 [Trichoderma atroviride IMI 206040]EHK42936.1 hypothetical protein TRIATDRAFT_258273 [Trichoderma atroviride IMI 206040]